MCCFCTKNGAFLLNWRFTDGGDWQITLKERKKVGCQTLSVDASPWHGLPLYLKELHLQWLYLSKLNVLLGDAKYLTGYAYTRYQLLWHSSSIVIISIIPILSVIYQYCIGLFAQVSLCIQVGGWFLYFILFVCF